MASAAVSSSTGHGPAFQAVPAPVLTTTTTSSKPVSQHVHTTLNYYKPSADGSPPTPTYVGKPETYDRPHEPIPVTITDVRGNEKEYTLDKNGFQFYEHISQEKDFLDEEQIKTKYYAETEQLLKDATGATRIFIFDHTIRRPPPPSSAPSPASALRGPVARVHIDQSYTAAASRVPHHLPDLAPALLRSRFQIINVWRPIKTILRDPLAVADAFSVEEEDLVPVALVYPDRRGETFAVLPNERHRWFYKSELSPEEVILIKCFDSDEGVARRIPHTAFEVPGQEKIEEARESIEARCLVFY